MIRRSPLGFVGIVVLACFMSNCLVVNINVTFPEKKIQSASEDIESQVRDQVLQEEGMPGPGSMLRDGFHFSFGMGQAWAAEPAIDLSQTNPVIRKIIETRQARFAVVNGYLVSGYIGEATDGFLKEIPNVKIAVADLAKVRKAVVEENNDRKRLFDEIGKVNKVTAKDLVRVQTIWAETNKKKLLAGQFYMTKEGKWLKKTQEEYEKDKKELEAKEKK